MRHEVPGMPKMKTSSPLLLAGVLSLLAIPVHAKGPRGAGSEAPDGERGSRPRPSRTAPIQGLQLASGLQTSGLLDGAALSVRLSDEDWRKVFARKEGQK